MVKKIVAQLARMANRGVVLLVFAILLTVGAYYAYQYFMRQAPVAPAQAVEGEFTIEQILLPEPGVIQVEVFNGSSDTIVVPQVLVDDAYWNFTVIPSTTISATSPATFTLPYPWVAGELHVVRLITSRGATFDGEVVGPEQ